MPNDITPVDLINFYTFILLLLIAHCYLGAKAYFITVADKDIGLAKLCKAGRLVFFVIFCILGFFSFLIVLAFKKRGAITKPS